MFDWSSDLLHLAAANTLLVFVFMDPAARPARDDLLQLALANRTGVYGQRRFWDPKNGAESYLRLASLTRAIHATMASAAKPDSNIVKPVRDDKNMLTLDA